jgi:chemotaxis protein CheC
LEIRLTDTETRLLATILELGAENAASAMSQWLGRTVRLHVSTIKQVTLEEASEVLGPGDELVAACAVEMTGALTGQLLLVFEDRSGLALADVLLGQPAGTAVAWGELERSAACETTNIVTCAYLNSVAAHLPGVSESLGQSAVLAPGPPTFRHEFAASLLEFALMDQAMSSDRLLLADTQFSVEETRLDWALLFVPSSESLRVLASALGGLEKR